MSGHIKAALSQYGIDIKTPGGAAAAGGAAGAAGGLLINLLRENPSLKGALRDMLVGGTVGATGGVAGSLAYGAAQDARREEVPPPPTAGDAREVLENMSKDRRSNAVLAGLSGYAPVAGPMLYGGFTGGPQESARLGIGSAAGTGIGALLAGLLTRGKGGVTTLGMGGVLGSMLGTGATAATDIGKSASAQAIGQKIDEGVKDLGKLTVSPLANTGGMAIGGTAGAALGGTAGLLQALFDSEDDGVISTLRKALTGGAIGGLGGAALGGVGAHVVRNRYLDKAEAAGKLGLEGRGRNLADQVLRRFVLPVGPTISGMSRSNPDGYAKEVRNANSREALLHMLAAAAAPRKTIHMLDGSVVPAGYRGGWDGRPETKGLYR